MIQIFRCTSNNPAQLWTIVKEDHMPTSTCVAFSRWVARCSPSAGQPPAWQPSPPTPRCRRSSPSGTSPRASSSTATLGRRLRVVRERRQFPEVGREPVRLRHGPPCATPLPDVAWTPTRTRTLLHPLANGGSFQKWFVLDRNHGSVVLRNLATGLVIDTTPRATSTRCRERRLVPEVDPRSAP